MTMGEKLRQARMEAGLSQRRVCGDRITRNQLSLLEHDRVGPSLELLRRAESQAPPAKAPQLWPLLEACCRECGDYRGAYEYATRQRTGPNPAW